MKRQISWRRMAQWLLVIVAWGYLVYRLVCFEDYDAFIGYFQQISWRELVFLLMAFVLFPVNVLFESLKWRTLLKDILPNMRVREAQKQTYNGFIGAFLTPGRLGDYPSRVLLIPDKNKWVPAIVMGFVGSMIMTCVIGIVGLFSCFVFWSEYTVVLLGKTAEQSNNIAQIIGLVFIPVVFVVFLLVLPSLSRWLEAKIDTKYHRWKEILRVIGGLDSKRLMELGVLCVGRYVVFCVQMYFILLCCGAEITIAQAIWGIPIYYFIITLFPSIPIADVAIKGSWAIIVFSSLGANVASITLATVLIWVINTICPMIVGSLKR